MTERKELSTLTTPAGTYDSFPDQAARETLGKIPEGFKTKIPGKVGQIFEIAAVDEEGNVTGVQAVDKPTGGSSDSGENDTAKTLLIAILRNAVYSTDQSANITALEVALGSSGESGGDEAATYTIINTLSNVINSNAAASVEANASYTAALTAADGYEISAVTVLMGGVDVTATAYANGVVSIAAVTGNIIITATAVIPDSGDDSTPTLLYNWDLTKSLTDTVGGITATLSDSGATQDENGLTISTANGYAEFLGALASGRTYEIDVASIDRQGSSHGRFFAWRSASGWDSGFIYRNSGVWAIYGAWVDSVVTDPAAFNGKTVTIKIDESKMPSVYCDGELIVTGTGSIAIDDGNYSNFAIGSPGGSSLYNATITAIRVYEGV